MHADALRATIEESIATKQRLLDRCLPQISALCDLAVSTLRAGGKLMLCGNGGAAGGVVVARSVGARGRPGALVSGYTTSGTSKNVVAALRKARELGLKTAVLTGERPGPCTELADVAVLVPSTNTARIQESHLLCTHLM